VHSKFKELLVILAKIPIVLNHLFAKFVKFVRECVLRVAGIEFKTFVVCNFYNFRIKLSR
jgi:hypothetical protein